MTRLGRIYLYDDPDSQGLDIDYLAGYLASELPAVEVGVRRDFLTHHLGRFSDEEREMLIPELSRQLEGAKTEALKGSDDPLVEGLVREAELGEMLVARPLQAALRLLVPEEEAELSHLHIVFVSELVVELGVADGLRLGVAALGAPTIVSTSGLIEAPRRPREYYFKKAQYVMAGADEYLLELTEEFADRTAGYGDPRLNELLKGYLLMAVVFRVSGDGPCTHPTCPLYAAETQEELMAAQVGSESKICRRHREMLDSIGGVG